MSKRKRDVYTVTVVNAFVRRFLYEQKKGKKVVAILLCGILGMSPINSMAMELELNDSLETKEVIMIDEGDFEKVFGETVEDNAIESVEYMYDYKRSEDDVASANIDLYIVIKVRDNEYYAKLQGNMTEHRTKTEKSIWMGDVDGVIEIGGIEYKTLACVLRFGEKMQVTVTIQSKEKEERIVPIAFVFGEMFFTQELRDEIIEFEMQRNEAIQGDIAARELGVKSVNVEDEFEQIAIQYVPFVNSNIYGVGHRMKGYYNSLSDRLAVTVMSKVVNVEEYYGYADVAVLSFSVQLRRGEGAVRSYIVGTENFDFNSASYGIFTNVLPLFEDIMSILGVPTATISAILSNVKGTVTRNLGSDNTKVEVNLGIFSTANFDESGAGIPIVFQLTESDYTYTGSHNYIISTSMKYITYEAVGSYLAQRIDETEDTEYSVYVWI